MRRRSGAARQVAAPQCGPDSTAWWESRLLPYQTSVVFIWSALTFDHSIIPGAALWTLVHLLLWSLFELSGSVLEGWGNLLVMAAILYALLQLGLRYGNLTSGPSSNTGSGGRFKEICALVAISSHVVWASLTKTLQSRHSNPKMFYGVGIILSFLFYHLGQWLSTPICFHIIVSTLLLLPLVLDQHKPNNSEPLENKLQRMKAELTSLAQYILARLKQTLNRRGPTAPTR